MSRIRRIEFQAPVWKTVIDPLMGWLVLELRDAEVLQAEFAVVELPEGKILQSGIRLPERWWVSLLTAGAGKFTVQQVHSSIKTAQIRKTWEVDGITGEITEKGEAAALITSENGMQKSDSLLPEVLQVTTPFHYVEGSKHYQTLHDFLVQKLDLSSVGPIEYAEVREQLLFSYYLKEGAGFDNYFVIFGINGQGSQPLRLATDLAGFGSGTFTIWQSKLVLCVTEYKSLLLIDL